MTATDTPRLGQPADDTAKPDRDDLTLWSVTTIIGCLDKPALLYWSAEQAARAAIASARTLQARVEEEGEAAVVKWLRDARFRRPKDTLSATDLGTVAHALAESYALTGTRPDRDQITATIREHGGPDVDIAQEGPVVVAMLDRFDDWLQRFTPEYQATEVAVYSPTYGYAGTVDAFLTIDGTRFIVDYKSTRDDRDSRGNRKTPYPEQVGLQLAAYRHAEFAAVWRPRRTEKFRRRYYLLSQAEREAAVPVPEVDTGLVIQLTPESCEAYPMRCDQRVHEAFLYVQEAARWVNETSRTVLGAPLTEGAPQ